MFVRDIRRCAESVASDKSALKEIFSPLKDRMLLRYSMAHAVVRPGKTTLKHTLKSSEVYYILKGKGIMQVDGEAAAVREGQVIYIPPNSVQRIENIGSEDLAFLCIVDPAWKLSDEQVLEK